MKALYDNTSYLCSSRITNSYSTSFSSAVRMLRSDIRDDIHAIYGFVRLADEIVDTFHDYDKEILLEEFKQEYFRAKERGISMNPVMNAFILTVLKYDIPDELVLDFLRSMEWDLEKKEYTNDQDYHDYIHGSADVVGLMCLKVFVHGNQEMYEELKESAKRLGSAFQKVNFLRDLKNDLELLDRSYFPNVDFRKLDAETKQEIIDEIEEDFRVAYDGLRKLPLSSRFGVHTAYKYYKRLLKKLKKTPSEEILNTRIRVSDSVKLLLLTRSYVKFKLNLL